MSLTGTVQYTTQTGSAGTIYRGRFEIKKHGPGPAPTTYVPFVGGGTQYTLQIQPVSFTGPDSTDQKARLSTVGAVSATGTNCTFFLEGYGTFDWVVYSTN